MKLKPDVKLRNQWFTSESMQHPAKGHLGLWWELIERYTEPGQTILDPMAGIGSTLIACLMGRNVICNEMETHFLVPMAASWQKMRRGGPMLGYSMGDALIIRGDARALPLASADAIITSPPWESVTWEKRFKDEQSRQEWAEGATSLLSDRSLAAVLRNTHRFTGYTRPVSAVITSPPYESAVSEGKSGIDWEKSVAKQRRPDSYNGKARERAESIAQGYTRPVNAVISSPPYEESLTTDASDYAQERLHNIRRCRNPDASGAWVNRSYGSGENIGNLRGPKYWEAMTAVYRECHRVLIPGGVMALVVKGFTRAKKYQDLPQQTADLIESLGFQVFDRWTREVPLSFWRTLQKQNGNWDEALRYEHVIAARKCHQVADVGDMMAGGDGRASNTRREKP